MAWRKVTGVLAAAAAGILLIGSPAAAAADPDITLKGAHVGSEATGNQCGAPFKNGQTEDGWHFVWPAGGNFDTVTLTFTDGADTVTVVIDSRDPLNPDVGGGADHPWSGFIWKTGSGKWKHLYVFTEAGWTLTGGEADATGGTIPSEFNLSHTCAGTGGGGSTPPTTSSSSGSSSTTTTTTTTTTSSPPDDDDPAPFPTPPVTPPGTPEPTPVAEMPVTGPSLTGLIIAGAALVVGGVALLFLRRRKSDASA